MNHGQHLFKCQFGLSKKVYRTSPSAHVFLRGGLVVQLDEQQRVEAHPELGEEAHHAGIGAHHAL